MRTTVTLDPDVLRLIETAMSRRQQSFKQVLNQAVRRGLSDLASEVREPPFEWTPKPMGLRAGIDPAHLNKLVDEAESDDFLSLAAHLRARSDDPAK